MHRALLFVSLVAFLGCGGSEGNPSDQAPNQESVLGISAAAETEAPPSESVDGVAEDRGASETPDSSELAEADTRDQDEAPLFESSSATPGAFPRPEHVRGIYLNAWSAGSSRRREALITLARQTEINAFVIDIKDATGYVSHDTRVPLAREVGADGERRIHDLPGLLQRLQEEGIYPIARIVIAKDPLLAAGRPDLAIQDSAGGPWEDQQGKRWLNFHNREVWEYHLDLAREVTAAGFPEIQWDYVRFPDAPQRFLDRAVYPGAEGRTRVDAVRGFLGYSSEVLKPRGVQVTIDVFGVTTSYSRDVGIGQVWESFIDQVDVALPMVYPSHYWEGSFGFRSPNAHPYEIVRRALRDAVSRSAKVEGAGSVRPWLQDFSLGDPIYDAPEVRAQIQATYDAGVQEWVLWNPGSRYTESALIPKGGLPSWLEPFMRVGGQVVPLSARWEVLGEEPPEGFEAPQDTQIVPDSLLSGLQIRPELRTLPPVTLPDTSAVVSPAGAGSGG